MESAGSTHRPTAGDAGGHASPKTNDAPGGTRRDETDETSFRPGSLPQSLHIKKPSKTGISPPLPQRPLQDDALTVDSVVDVPAQRASSGQDCRSQFAEMDKIDPTPLPLLPLVVICLTLFVEPLAASVANPFIFFMLADFGLGQGADGDAEVGFMAGLTASFFFGAQFLTSLIWARQAEKYGKKKILALAMVGSAASTLFFGMSGSVMATILIRMTSGIFNGAVGIARSSIKDLTDPTNEAKAYTYAGLLYGLGGIVGPILGGFLEHPARNIPFLFNEDGFFGQYPYLLPCLVASIFGFVGSILALFLPAEWNVGSASRGGPIQLPEKKDEDNVIGAGGILRNISASKVKGRISGIVSQIRGRPLDRGDLFDFSQRDLSASDATGDPEIDGEDDNEDTLTIGRNIDQDYETLPLHRTSHSDLQVGRSRKLNPSAISTRSRNVEGSAYGYDYPRRSSHRQQAGEPGASRIGTASRFTTNTYAANYASEMEQAQDDQDLQYGVGSTSGLTLAQRLLMANADLPAFSVADFFIASQQQSDDNIYEDQDGDFWESRSTAPALLGELGDYGSDDGEDSPRNGFEDQGDNIRFSEISRASRRPTRSGITSSRFTSLGGVEHPQSRAGSAFSFRRALHRPSQSVGPHHSVVSRPNSSGFQHDSRMTNRLPSEPHSTLTPIAERGHTMAGAPSDSRPSNEFLAPMTNASRISFTRQSLAGMHGTPLADAGGMAVKGIPYLLILNYALCALHGTLFDQVSTTFIVTPYATGGLELTSMNLGQLVAAMGVVQIVCQFYVYPRFSRRFDTLWLYRIGLLMYIPCYLFFPALRNLSGDGQDRHVGLVMFTMIVMQATRFLANVLAYTAIMILINVASPLPLLSLSNGLAQSSVSLARCAGPIVGGILWGVSIANDGIHRSWPLNQGFGFVCTMLVTIIAFILTFKML